jgi:hypothetical protein
MKWIRLAQKTVQRSGYKISFLLGLAIRLVKTEIKPELSQISGSHGGEYVDGCLVGCCAV